MVPIDCIITAAGLSSRMGQWKMILPWRDGTMLDASIKNALQFCSRIILVTGFRHEELAQRYIHEPQIFIVYNPDYQSGLLTSVQAGAAQVMTEYCYLTHGDLPCLQRTIFNNLWHLRGDYALMPQYRGKPGHPILLPRERLLQAARLTEVRSMREALMAGEYRFCEMNHPEIIFDVDTPEDFMALQNRHREN
ncbi:molybdenum cofactor cytidylyltransferase [Atlantibacter subterranea]|uniref:Molybdenum cofactor cytidylyltransferase n=1 Tax=Atlantibacter subterraneus TaxID=255519 RepID=A0A427UPB1_9ENTR|nr:NTP transferase domain-containing protein [Atlantibacter subterranea]MDA3133652.1 NTP transferase domain-containing protein [Atlantibacter subterranea]RSB59502.1 molybdenum cofactor cytidylyltransferase [Atlantibacter subterranea]RSE01591.1 molybdenum cofactor cytidylyltransferase [Atlantibacter subterranea]RSE22363.1 molybdenum cofactor cytidylyltransferase [Atlantibacter subterranea]